MITLQELRPLLQRVEYPATRDDILAQLRRLEAAPAVLARVDTLPDAGDQYGSVDSVLDALRHLE